ncbi:MAG: FG-GAP repeat protein [Planctomycetes bacterium]|nr:FG-GAP repeat protein [Planctomycetota bacterium]
MRHFLPLLATAAFVLSPAAYADLGDQLFKLLPDDGAPSDEFGWSVAISGEVAIVGAHLDDAACPSDPECNSGSAYLFDVATGQQLHKLVADDADAWDEAGKSVSISGNVALVGARFDDDACPENPFCDSGSAYLFDVLTGQQLHKLIADDAVQGDVFGASVGISGGLGIVGAPGDDDAGTSSGAVYVFDVATGQQLRKLTADDAEMGDRFGTEVAISGNIAIIGVSSDDDAGSASGSAYLFDVTTGQQLHKLTADDADAGDRFGDAVAIHENTAIVGAWRDADFGLESGSVYVFDVTTGEQLHKLTASDASAFAKFGRSVSISGGIAIVGAPWDNDEGSVSGSAYLFDAVTGEELHKLAQDDAATLDWFGRSVGISAGVAIAGAYADDDACPDDSNCDSGSAYLFDATGASACPWDFDGDGAVGPFDLAFLLGFWGPNPDHPADFDGDGEVGPLDLALVLGNWGPCP